MRPVNRYFLKNVIKLGIETLMEDQIHKMIENLNLKNERVRHELYSVVV
jgi:hypothetical protein